MNSKILSLSLTTMNYLALNAVNKGLPSANELMDEEPYAALVVDQIDYWIQEVDNSFEEEPEILTVLRLDTESELIDGNYLENGVDSFIERVHAYFNEQTSGAYAQMLIDVAKDLRNNKSLPN